VSLCTHCHREPIPPRHRLYCKICSRLASRIWKARERRRWTAAWRANGRSGPPPYLDGWRDREAYRTYYREYMRRWRRHQAEEARVEAGRQEARGSKNAKRKARRCAIGTPAPSSPGSGGKP
jgi:hypothetical protein